MDGAGMKRHPGADAAPAGKRAAALLLSVSAVLCAACGCESTAEIIQEREKLKNHAHLAQLYYDKGRFPQAVNQAEKALEIDETYVKARCVLGFACLQVSRIQPTFALRTDWYEKAELHFSRVISDGTERDSFVFKSYFGLGLLYFQWAKDVDAQIGSTGGKAAPLVDGPATGEEDLWKE